MWLKNYNFFSSPDPKGSSELLASYNIHPCPYVLFNYLKIFSDQNTWKLSVWSGVNRRCNDTDAQSKASRKQIFLNSWTTDRTLASNWQIGGNDMEFFLRW
jgi:hypothetical protein